MTQVSVRRVLRIEDNAAILFGGAAPVAAPLPERSPRLGDALWQLDRQFHGGTAAALHAAQLEVGAALAEAYLPAPVAAALRADLAAVEGSGGTLLLGFEVAGELLGLPWETLCLASGEALALHPRVSFYRRVKGLAPVEPLGVPGPLRILVAIGSPEAQNERGELLDMEKELGHILDAVEPARRAQRPAYVRILEFGTVEAIRAALLAERYHVLHISCHAAPGFLALEDEHGKLDLVTAERLWREALPAGRGVPLVVLAGCSTALEGDGITELPSLARLLLEHGAPAVVAMRTSVGDAYATAFAAELYAGLAGGSPEPLAAFTEARLTLERTQRLRPEWSTPLLFLRGEGSREEGLPLYDPLAPPAKIHEPVTPRLAAGVLVRRPGEFVGRRADQRRILKVLAEPEVGGVLIRGLGGLGKSTLSAQLAQKLGGEGWLVVSQYGTMTPEGILDAIGVQLVSRALKARHAEDHPHRTLAQVLRQRDLEPLQRFEILGEHLLDELPLLLLLDNFEDNLTPIEAGARDFSSPQLAEFLAAWLERPGRSRLLLTCRYPLPFRGIAGRRLREHPLGPLSQAEARKLYWRLPALAACSAAEQEKARLTVGGHPRALEYLDALLAGGKARFADLEVRLEAALAKKGVDDPAAWLGEGRDFDSNLAETVSLAADDVLLESLLERLRQVPLAERLLLGASVYRLPVEEKALVWQLGEAPALPRNGEPDPLPEVAAQAGFAAARDQLARLGLLAPVESEAGPRQVVHRWTASRLAEKSQLPELAEAHRRAALYWRWHFAKEPQSREQDMADLLEARYHHHQAGELAEAVLVTEWVCSQLDTWGAYRQEEQLIHDLLGWLPPEGTEKVAAFLHQLGNVAYQRGDYEQALVGYRKSLEINEALGNRAGMASSYHQFGMVAQQRGDYDQALEWYRKSLEINEALGNRAGMAIFYHQLGMVAQERGDYDQALEWYRKSLEIKEALGNRSGMAKSRHQLGMIAQERGDYEQALEWYRKSLEIDEALGNRAGMASSCSQIGALFTERGDPAAGVTLNLRSLAIRLELRVPQVRIDLHWLGRQRELLGEERFREVLSEHLDADAQAAVLQMLDDATKPAETEPAAGRGSESPEG